MMQSHGTPLYDKISAHSERRPTAFHMPGHKLGRALPARFDLTELDGLDNLYGSEGVIRDAQIAAAASFGADHTRFLVNGSTGGLQAAILYACAASGLSRPVIVAGRDSHRSVVNGAMLSRAGVVAAGGGADPATGIPEPTGPAGVAAALDGHPEAAAVVVTRPTYYGMCADLREIARVTHERGCILIVDEAHGAHLGFSPRLPKSAMDCDADICVQSAHKTLPALTQGAYLHVKGPRIDMEALDRILETTGTSSPSYPIMASLEIAAHVMVTRGAELLDGLQTEIARFSHRLAHSSVFRIIPASDPTRVVIDVTGAGISGFKAAEILGRRFGIFVEMGDLRNIVLITTIADRRRDFDKLYNALMRLAPEGYAPEFSETEADHAARAYDACTRRSPGTGGVLTPARDLKPVWLPLDEAAGKKSADCLTPYPPGIPLVYPGEAISREAIDFITAVRKHGGRVDGLRADGSAGVSL